MVKKKKKKKNPPANAGDTGEADSIPRLEICPGGGNANALQYSCLGNTMGREAYWTIQSTGLQRVRQDGACMHRAAGTGGGWKRDHSCPKRQPLPPSFKLELKFKSESTVSHPNERPRAPRRAVCDPAGRRSTQ